MSGPGEIYTPCDLEILPAISCRKPYEPPAIKASGHILAVDGLINTGANSSSRFFLTRSEKII